MVKIPHKIQERIKAALRRFKPLLKAARERDALHDGLAVGLGLGAHARFPSVRLVAELLAAHNVSGLYGRQKGDPNAVYGLSLADGSAVAERT